MKEAKLIDNLEFKLNVRNSQITELEMQIKQLNNKNRKLLKENKELKEKIIEQNRQLQLSTSYLYKEETPIEEISYGNSNKDLRIKLTHREQKIKMLERKLASMTKEQGRW